MLLELKLLHQVLDKSRINKRKLVELELVTRELLKEKREELLGDPNPEFGEQIYLKK
jgi:hypothetical protein